MIEDKIIDDVLIYLDGWELQNKSHKVRHKPHPPQYLDAFNEDTEDIENTNIRKTVTSKEILSMYEIAKVHVLNYIKRPVFPRTPTTHIALCMWTAGLLSQKSRFRKQRVENSYNLIKEAQKLLKPHIKNNIYATTISGRDDMEFEPENYRLYNEPNPNCKKIHRKKPKHHPCIDDHPKHHHHPHKHHPPFFEYDEPEYDNFFLKDNHIVLKLTSTSTRGDGTITLKGFVRDKYGNKQDDGEILFYLEAEETDETSNLVTRRRFIDSATVTNGECEYTWIIPKDLVGLKTVYATYQDCDEYIRATAYVTIILKKGLTITVDDLQASHGKTNVPLFAHIIDLENNPVTGGEVQFQINNENVGEPVPVMNGVATYILNEIPSTMQNNDQINAVYSGTELYANSTANTMGIFTLLDKTGVTLQNISANTSETIQINATITNEQDEPITSGEYSLYLDDQLIETGQVTVNGTISTQYTLPDDIEYGEHTLTIQYNGSETQDTITQSSTLIIRSPITIVMDDIEGNLTEPVTLTTHVTYADNQPVNTGEVTYYVDDE